jgi:hypothetical protein
LNKGNQLRKSLDELKLNIVDLLSPVINEFTITTSPPTINNSSTQTTTMTSTPTITAVVETTTLTSTTILKTTSAISTTPSTSTPETTHPVTTTANTTIFSSVTSTSIKTTLTAATITVLKRTEVESMGFRLVLEEDHYEPNSWIGMPAVPYHTQSVESLNECALICIEKGSECALFTFIAFQECNFYSYESFNFITTSSSPSQKTLLWQKEING